MVVHISDKKNHELNPVLFTSVRRVKSPSTGQVHTVHDYKETSNEHTHDT